MQTKFVKYIQLDEIYSFDYKLYILNLFPFLTSTYPHWVD